MALVIAHRGARSLAPENTLIAAKKAYESGADLWETDINISKDGSLVLFHDENLLRCTDVKSKFASRSSYLLRDYSFKELQLLDAGSYFIETDPFNQIALGNVPKDHLSEFNMAAIPSLEHGLEFTQKMNWKINLELKDFTQGESRFFIPDQTLEIIERSNISMDKVVISSFNHNWLKRVAGIAPKIEVQALVGENDTDPLDFGDFEFSTYNINANLVNEGLIKKLKFMGKKINLFTVNDPETFSWFDKLGVDGMFTDFPQLFS